MHSDENLLQFTSLISCYRIFRLKFTYYFWPSFCILKIIVWKGNYLQRLGLPTLKIRKNEIGRWARIPAVPVKFKRINERSPLEWSSILSTRNFVSISDRTRQTINFFNQNPMLSSRGNSNEGAIFLEINNKVILICLLSM